MRRIGLLLSLALALAALVSVPGSRAQQAQAAGDGRPNIVVVMLDDMRWDELRFAPNVNRYLTSRGVTFANAFSPLPLCCPARASFLLGEYAHNHQVLTVDPPYGFGAMDDHQTIATQLQAAGYRTALIGKYLNGYGRQPSKVTGGPSLLYRPAGWTDWMASTDSLRFHGGGTYNYLHFTQNVNGRIVQNKRTYSSDVVGAEARKLVDRYRTGSAPFFLFLTPVAPHSGLPVERKRDPRNYTKANGYVQQFPTPYTPKWVRHRFDSVVTHAPGVPLSHDAETDISDKPPWYQMYLENTQVEKDRLREVERQRVESIYAWDVQFGRLVRRMQADHVYDNTVFVFTSDNGYYLGEHRHPAGKIEPHDVSIRVPLIVAGPGVQHATRYYPAMTHDLTSTILDLAHAPSLPSMDGTSLVPVLAGADATWDHPVLTEARIQGLPTDPTFPTGLTEMGVRTARWKYVRYSNGSEELYDLQHDPNELTGLQDDPAYTDIKAELAALWTQYAGCRGSQCTVPLPDDLQVDPASMAGDSAFAGLAWNAYYNS